jgi:PAS domain S-box-containing protein
MNMGFEHDDIVEKIIKENTLYSISDINGNILEISKYLLDLLGYSEHEVIGENHRILRYEKSSNQTYNKMWSIILSGETYTINFKNKTKEGAVKYFNTTIIPLKKRNTISSFLAIRNDVTESTLKHRYCHITNLRSKNNLIEYISKYPEQYFCSVLLNIDDFSLINEVYGGEVGNSVLRAIGEYLEMNELGFYVYRLQSDEFILIKSAFHKIEGKENSNKEKKYLRRIIKHIEKEIKTNFTIGDLDIKITFTSGITCSKGKHVLLHCNTAFKNARLNNEKSAVFKDEMLDLEAKVEKINMIKLMHEALSNNGVFVEYQPIICNKTLGVVKHEALIRIKDNDTIVSPFKFLELSQVVKLYSDLSRTLIKKAFEKFRYINMEFTINLLKLDIEDPVTKKLLETELNNFPNPENVTLEIVESSDFEEYTELNRFVKSMKEYGAKVAIDDFGHKNSNYSHIANIDFDYIKIDGQFVKNIENSVNRDIVENIVALAKRRGIKTIAEYVENEEIFNIMKDIGVDYSQGYFFGKPAEKLQGVGE